ncbi:hypothetical protein GCM10007094_34410 [Pseudovibrio japonicus]|uniref:TehB/YeaR-like domain-containing protein n=1 Tax=Pseudovibrio japonicus TaxID=366534 RepID=A0ABQ3EJ91_9HYPH|nr:DUF1971 domain-containing protein [Pseudovibrio japonicus]GHB42304.1 hypothetical protein GCM10007094_34410 [Pseudovibrio japonicus]
MPLLDLKLPDGVVKYSTTKEFSEGSFPKALERDHSTKPGVWGVLCVTSGSVVFHDVKLNETREIQTGEKQVILPETLHSARASKDARFFVEFYSANQEQPKGAAEEGA